MICRKACCPGAISLGFFLLAPALLLAADEPAGEAAVKIPWRGSQVVFSNSFSLISLDPSQELTYNPSYSMVFGFKPRWWFGEKMYLAASLDVTRELTQADDTTYAREALLGDLGLTFGVSRLWTVPVAGIDLSGDITVTLPTSKASQARTLVMGIGPRLRLSRNFPLLKGLVAGFNLRATPYFHRYTTAETESPLIANCQASEAGCGAFLNSGVRNSLFRLTGSLDASLAIFDWLGVSLAFGEAIDWLYGIGSGDDQVSFVPVEPQDQRYLSFFELGVSFSPLAFLDAAVTLITYAPQLAPDSSYYNPFFNRYTIVSLDLIFKLEGLTALAGGK